MESQHRIRGIKLARIVSLQNHPLRRFGGFAIPIRIAGSLIAARTEA